MNMDSRKSMKPWPSLSPFKDCVKKAMITHLLCEAKPCWKIHLTKWLLNKENYKKTTSCSTSTQWNQTPKTKNWLVTLNCSRSPCTLSNKESTESPLITTTTMISLLPAMASWSVTSEKTCPTKSRFMRTWTASWGIRTNTRRRLS